MRRACAVALLALVALAAHAEKADRDKPTQVEANRMSADDVRKISIFEGNVVVTKGTVRVTAERVVVRQDPEGFQTATATGRPARFRQRQDPRPGEKEGVWLDGEALRIEIDDRNQKVELHDNARVTRGCDEVTGDSIFVDQRSDFYEVKGGKDSGAKGRVKMTIQPKGGGAEPTKPGCK